MFCKFTAKTLQVTTVFCNFAEVYNKGGIFNPANINQKK